ncbi:MAG: hypothetical protein BGO43_01285 [Gammaproteobacteria bacterium 39-13]|nr:M61 family metallopeptidase [Gammaproteobacteria bacterium]OJV89022.1 MAG: hypothetical protein BGO43_01285 [Gammaproteobacteria bacterium 39-13]
MIHYDVNAKQPSAHIFNIRMRITKPSPDGQKVSLPNWIPGSYLIRDFAKHIIQIAAFEGSEDSEDALKPITIDKIDSNTWECGKTNEHLILEYTVYAWDNSVRGSHLDENHAFFNPCSLFLMVHGQENSPCKVNLSAPDIEEAKAWQVATTLPREDAKPWGFGGYIASSYEELIDHPVEMGRFDRVQFVAGGVPHTIVVSGKHDGDLDRLAEDVRKICENQINLFGNAPFQEYLFLLTVQREGYGGLEHRSSSALICQRDALPVLNDPSLKPAYITLLGLFSHEYFHAWNIKRIKPESFMPYHLDQKSYTRQLWAFEGITSYYDELALVRSKVINTEQYLDILAQSLTRVLRASGRKKQTITESSFDAWIKYYQPNENAANAIVSYYLKGAFVGLLFDMALRQFSENRVSMDDVMRFLWREYGERNIGVPEGKIEEIIQEMAGEKISTLVFDALYTTKELPLEIFFQHFGLTLKLRGAVVNEDLGGKKALTPSTETTIFKQGVFGFSIQKVQGRIIVTQVSDDSAAQLAGISAQDEIIAINGMRVDSESFDKIAKRLRIGQEIKVHVFRQDLLKEKLVILKAPPLDTAEISMQPNMNEAQRRNLELWLS